MCLSVCVYLSLTTLAATYLAYTSNITYRAVLYGVFKRVVLTENVSFKVLASFADHGHLSHFLKSS